MNKIRTLIVDDEPAAIEGLRLRLQGFADIEVVSIYRTLGLKSL